MMGRIRFIGWMGFIWFSVSVAMGADEVPDWLFRAAEQGLPDSQYALGILYEKGEGVPRDIGKARHWVQRAADGGSDEAKMHLLGMPKGFENLSEGQNAVGRMDFIGSLQERAEKGDVQAQCEMARRYFVGEGVAKDQQKAAHWLTMAAKQGDALSQYQLGLMYYYGDGVVEDKEEAIRWLYRACKGEEPQAQYRLGRMLIFGDSVKKDIPGGMKLFEKAEKHHHSEVQYNLGVMYLNGTGIPKNPQKALELFRDSAERGYSLAQYALGRMYYLGEGVGRNKAEASRWIQMAADQGHEEALAILRKLKQEQEEEE